MISTNVKHNSQTGSKRVCCGVASLFSTTSIFHRQMTALTGNCIKVLGHGPLRVNAKSKNMITCKTSKLTSKTKIFHIYSAVFSKKSELSVLAFHKLYIDERQKRTCHRFLRKRLDRISRFLVLDSNKTISWPPCFDFSPRTPGRYAPAHFTKLQNSADIWLKKTETEAEQQTICRPTT